MHAWMTGSGTVMRPHHPWKRGPVLQMDPSTAKALEPARDCHGQVVKSLVVSPLRRCTARQIRRVGANVKKNLSRHYSAVLTMIVKTSRMAARLHAARMGLRPTFARTLNCSLLGVEGVASVGPVVLICTSRAWKVAECFKTCRLLVQWMTPEGKALERAFHLHGGWTASSGDMILGRVISVRIPKVPACGVHYDCLRSAHLKTALPYKKLIYNTPAPSAKSAVGLINKRGVIFCPSCHKTFVSTEMLSLHYGIVGRWKMCEWKTFQEGCVGDA